MPGLGRKVFSAGEVLTAANVQGYLQDQAVMVFAGTAASGSALGTAVSEGMVRYVQDTNELHFYDGSTWTDVGVVDVAGKNRVINGGFDFWQRGTSFADPNFTDYTADRWRMINYDNKPSSATHTRQSFTPGAAPVSGYEGQYFYRSTINAVGSCTIYEFGQYIEDVRTFAGQTATLSFWAKADSARTLRVFAGRNMGSGGSGGGTVTVGNDTFNLTTSWQRFSTTITYSSLAGSVIGTNSSIWIMFRQAAASGSVLDIWGVQLESGQVASPFSRAAGTLQGELAACQRYYFRCNTTDAFGIFTNIGPASSSTLAKTLISFPVEMRIAPTSLEYSTVLVDDLYTGGQSATALNATNRTTKMAMIEATVASGLTTGRSYVLRANNSTSAFIGINAEL